MGGSRLRGREGRSDEGEELRELGCEAEIRSCLWVVPSYGLGDSSVRFAWYRRKQAFA